jgi:hypothetical protein
MLAQPPGPGLPVQAPSVKINTDEFDMVSAIPILFARPIVDQNTQYRLAAISFAKSPVRVY